MVRSRTATAVVGLAASLLVSVALWWYFNTLAVFLVVPFVPLLLRGRGGDQPDDRLRECPQCGFRTADPAHAYCPRDGTRLE
jgi:hypothetical protein